MGRLRGFVAPLKNCSSKEPSSEEEGGEVEPFDAVTSELARCSSSYNLHATDRALMPCQMQPGQNKAMFYPDIKIVTLEPSCLRYLCSQTISPNLLLSNTDPNPAILVGSTAKRSLFYQSCVLVILVGSSAILVLIQGRTILVDRKAKLLLPPHFPKLPLFICPRFRGHVNVCAQSIRPFCPGSIPVMLNTLRRNRSQSQHRRVAVRGQNIDFEDELFG